MRWLVNRDWLAVASSTVPRHEEIMQGVLVQMAENARTSEARCAKLVSATLGLCARLGRLPRASTRSSMDTMASVRPTDAYPTARSRALLLSRFAVPFNLHDGALGSPDTFNAPSNGLDGRLNGKSTAGFGSSLAIPSIGSYLKRVDMSRNSVVGAI